MGLTAVAATALALAGCVIGTWPTPEDQKNKKPSAPACSVAADCPAGNLCLSGQCLSLCLRDADCPAGNICSNDVCTAGVRTEPRILDVTGNAPGDPTAIIDGLVIVGDALDNAVAELVSPALGPVPLVTASQSATAMAVQLPADVRSGAYTLRVINASGSDQVMITLTLPELTGDLLLDRINTTATGTVAVTRLPVGTGSGDVAAGDHTHATGCPAGTARVMSSELCIDAAWTTVSDNCATGERECRLQGKFLCPHGVAGAAQMNPPAMGDRYALAGAVGPCGDGTANNFTCGIVDGAGAYRTQSTDCPSEIQHRYICCAHPR